MAHNHILYLGKLVGNLQSLEALLRVYLLKVASRAKGGSQTGPSYWGLAVGDNIAEDEFSNYDSLGDLIKRFNAEVTKRDLSLLVDASVVDIRDILAHGRVGGDAPDTSTLRIVKFGKPSQGRVAVIMDEQWFGTNITLVREQIERVSRALANHAA